MLYKTIFLILINLNDNHSLSKKNNSKNRIVFFDYLKLKKTRILIAKKINLLKIIFAYFLIFLQIPLHPFQ